MSNYAWKPIEYIWLYGFGFVHGWKTEELNKYIDKWNNEICSFVPSNTSFFDWLSYETGENYHGIYWQNKNFNFHTIKSAGGNYNV